MSAPRLTVARVRASLYDTVSPGDPGDEKFLRLLNQFCERAVDSGSWSNSDFAVELTPQNGIITLPRRASALKGFRVQDGPNRAIFPKAYEYLEVGSAVDEATYLSAGFDAGDSCVHTDIPEPANLVLTISNPADAGLTATLRGFDANGNRIFTDGVDGETVVLASPSVTTAAEFAELESITISPTAGTVTLSDGTTELGFYEPGETDPVYRRYKVGLVPDGHHIFALCSRRHVELVSESDLVFPANIGALKHGLLGLMREDNGDLQGAAVHFGQAYSLLNAEIKRLRGRARPLMNIVMPRPVRRPY